jgi:hypothetical protein
MFLFSETPKKLAGACALGMIRVSGLNTPTSLRLNARRWWRLSHAGLRQILITNRYLVSILADKIVGYNDIDELTVSQIIRALKNWHKSIQM